MHLQVRRPLFDPLGQKQLQLACRRSEARLLEIEEHGVYTAMHS